MDIIRWRVGLLICAKGFEEKGEVGGGQGTTEGPKTGQHSGGNVLRGVNDKMS
jgi:hypothetical protein